MNAVNTGDTRAFTDNGKFADGVVNKRAHWIASYSGGDVAGHQRTFARCVLGSGRIASLSAGLWNLGTVPQGPDVRVVMHATACINHDAVVLSERQSRSLDDRAGRHTTGPDQSVGRDPLRRLGLMRLNLYIPVAGAGQFGIEHYLHTAPFQLVLSIAS